MDVTTALPGAEALAVSGMAVVGLFGLWRIHVEPYLARRRAQPSGV